MKVSVITINFNNLTGLKNTRESLVNQSFKDWEWIVIDGGSSQGDRLFIEQHQSEMAYWCCEKDNGVYNAMNKGIAKATGDYYIFMNSGDEFHDQDVLKHIFENTVEGDVLYGDWMLVFENGKLRKINAPKTFSLHSICKDNICHQAMFIKGELMKRFPYDESYRLYADWSKWIELALKGFHFVYVPYVVCNFMMGGISSTHEVMAAQEKERMLRELIPISLRETIKAAEVKHPLAAEVDQLITKRKLYKKIIHMAVRICHIL